MTELVLVFGTLLLALGTSTAFAFLAQAGNARQRRH